MRELSFTDQGWRQGVEHLYHGGSDSEEAGSQLFRLHAWPHLWGGQLLLPESVIAGQAKYLNPAVSWDTS